MEKVRKEARRKLDLLRKLRRWRKVVTALAGVVVFCTTYALILPAITMTTPLMCEKEEHTHTDECYQIELVVAERKLICSLPEAEPHTHTDDCWTEVTVPACGLEETEGHTHTDACYTEVTTYVCGLEEAEGHAHTADCYTRTQGDLLCDKEFDTVERQVETVVERSAVDENGETVDAPETVIETVTETVPHVHTDDCYAWTEELTCSLEETEGHAHTNECAQTERVLTCELVEAEGHIHTEECGTETQKVLSCGLEETEGHAHTDECYEIPGNEGELVEVRTLVCEKEEHTHDDNCYYGLELEEKVKYYCGFDTQHTHDESCYFEDGTLKCNIPEHTHTDECLVEPLPEPVPVELDETFTAESEDGAVILNLHVTGTVLLPQTAQPAEGEEPQEEVGFQLLVTESEDYEAYDEYAALAAKEGEVVAMGVLDYTLTYNGETVDLTGCEVTVEVEPTEAFQAFMDDPQTLEAMGAMTLDLTDEAETDETPDPTVLEPMFTAYTLQRSGTVGYSVTMGNNVTFYVQYYAWMDRLVTENGTGVALNVIDTDNGGTGAGGRLPKNGQPQATRTGEEGKTPIRNIYVGTDNKLETRRVLTEIYKRGEAGAYDPQRGSEFKYFNAPGLQYFNMVSNVADIQYIVNEVWIQKGGVGDPTSTNAADWQVFPYEEGVTRFTNRPETAASNPDSYILLEDDDVIRLIYAPTEKNEIFPVDFYDYDISDGTSKQGDKNMNTRSGDAANGTNFGINEGTIPSGKTRFGFGNKNTDTSTALSGGTWWNDGVSNLINAANAEGSWSAGYTDTSYNRCAFNLVSGMNADGNDVNFSDGIVGPSLFGADDATGKTLVEGINEIQFSRMGDTYTLSEIPGRVSQLDTFSHPGNYTNIWTNHFWPLDNIYGVGTTGHDIMFGDGTQYRNGDGNRKFAANDDGLNHNSYFGMNFAVEFELTKNYIGPLEYYFFGDDDMWVFLSEVTPVLGDNGKPVKDENGKVKTQIIPGTNRQIVDIGGLHSAVGQYVNLWDHVNTDSWDDECRTYRLTFFYTERGAGGSTCWMQFTLPTVVGVDLETQINDLLKESTGNLRIQKEMGGIEENKDFTFMLNLAGSGVDNYKASILRRNADGTTVGAEEAIGNNGTFTLKYGEVMVIYNLPLGTEYTITELNDENKAGYHTTINTELYATADAVDPVPGNAITKVEAHSADTPAATSGKITEEAKNKLISVIFTNTATFELPATGGSGTTLWYTMGTMLLLGAAYLMYKKRQWLLREEDAM